MDGRAPALARGVDAAAYRLLQSGRVLELATGGHDVGAGLEQAAHLVEIALLRHVEHAVGPEGEDLVDAVSGQDAGRAAEPLSSPASRPTLSGEYT